MQKFQVINKFDGKYKMFSNFYPVKISYSGIIFPTVEHAFVASKSTDPMFWYKISCFNSSDAGKVKRLGRKVKLRENWEVIKLSNMKIFLTQKFNNKEFKDLLLSTGNSMIIEGNYWHDNFWGACHCKKCAKITGQNNLGKLLMELRRVL